MRWSDAEGPLLALFLLQKSPSEGKLPHVQCIGKGLIVISPYFIARYGINLPGLKFKVKSV